MRMWKKGSFTIEAAILIPLLLFLFVGVLQIGITFFENSVRRECYEGIKNLDVVRRFYDLQIINEIGKDYMQ